MPSLFVCFLIVQISPNLLLIENTVTSAESPVSQPADLVEEYRFSDQPTIYPPAKSWFTRADEMVDVLVLTRDLHALGEWQKKHGFGAEQALLKGGQSFEKSEIDSDSIQHRKVTATAQMVPKLLGVRGVISIFEDPGVPNPINSESGDAPQVNSVVTGQLHGAADSWLMGVDGGGVKVAVVDSGIDFAHPDLNGTQARVDDPTSPYDGWPIMWDPRSIDIWLADGDAYPDNGGSYYSDTSNLDNDSNNDSFLDLTGFNISGIPPSLSGVYHTGQHPDSALKTRAGGDVDILVVDDITAGVYETVYVDFDRDGQFGEEIAIRRGNETAGLDTNGDGLWDQSAGLVYWVSDGVNGVPYSSTYSARAGFQNRIASAGDLVLWMIDDQNDPGGNHGTLCASAVSAQGSIANGKVVGMAPGSELIAVADFYAGGSWMDAWRFLTEGYDGVTDSGDEAQVGSFSFGWSNVHNDGTDQMALYLDWLTRVHSRNTTILVAVGNGGHGYGTTASPGGAHGVVSVGAFSSQTGQPHGGTWGDAAAWSNRGPNAGSRLDPDIVTVGWSATGDRGLNEVTNANSAYRTWGGTSLATPIGAGLVALIYEAWMQEHGVWPDAMTVRNLLMSTAEDRGYDPLVQGAGFADVKRAIEVIKGINGSAWVEPAYWMAGANHGTHREANTNIMMAGQTAWANFTVNNTGLTPLNVSWEGATLTPLAHHSEVWNSSTSLGWDGYQSSRPDLLIPVHIKGDANLSLPAGTSIVRARAALAGAGFDGNNDLSEENRVHVELMRWHDDDGDGRWWTDSNNNSLVDSGEMESSSEYSMVTAHTYASGQSEVRIGQPHKRSGDGILLGVYRRNIRTDVIDPIPIEVDWTAFGPDNNATWLDICSGNTSIQSSGVHHLNCRVNVPVDADPGIRQEQVHITFEASNISHTWAVPVIVNVASDGPMNLSPLPIDGNMSNQSLYSETWLQGAQRWSWRSESGDWKFVTFDWPYNLSGDGAIVMDVDWPDNQYTDVDVFWMSETGHPYYSEDPTAYGQYNLVPEVSSKSEDLGNGKYRWQTSTGGSHEVLIAEATPGIKQMMLHSVRHGVNTNDNPVNISVGLVDAIDGSLTRVVRDWADGEGDEVITIGSTLPIDVSSIEGFGWTQPVLLPSETATQDTPGTWSSSGYTHEIDVEGAELLKVEIDSLATLTDLDLALYRDKNGNGVLDWGSEQIATSGNWNSAEEISIESPTDGKWWAVVHGFDVPSGNVSFWLRQTVIAGNSLLINDFTPLNQSDIVTRFPNGSSELGGRIPISAFDVNLSLSLPQTSGLWEGFIVVNLASGGSIRLAYDYRLEELPPQLQFMTPANLTHTNQTIPLRVEAHDFSGGFSLSELFMDTSPLLEWRNASYTVEGLAEKGGPTHILSDSWSHWNEFATEDGGSHFHLNNGSLVFEAENATSVVAGADGNAPKWVETQLMGETIMASSDNSGWQSSTFSDGDALQYPIEFDNAGTYYLWARMNASNASDDSIHVGLNGSLITQSGPMKVNPSNSWEWTNLGGGPSATPIQFSIPAAGRYNLSIWMYEDGIKLDKFIITDSWSFVASGNPPSTQPIVDMILRSAWLNLTLPADNGWRTFNASLSDVAGRGNSSQLMVNYDDINPTIMVNGWKFLTNNSIMHIEVQTEIGSSLYLNGTEIAVDEDGRGEAELLLHPTYWVNLNGDGNNPSTWDWVDLNTFTLVARDAAGNWNNLEFDVAYDAWGASNYGQQPQIGLLGYSGDSDDGSWRLTELAQTDRLNAKQSPINVELDLFYDTRIVCIQMIDESGIEWQSSCTERNQPPWGDDISQHMRAGAPPPESDLLTLFTVPINHSGLPDGRWQLFVETQDWAGNWGWENFTLLLDREAPLVSWVNPISNETLFDHRLVIEWQLSEYAQHSLTVDGEIVGEFEPGQLGGQFAFELESIGSHQLCLLAQDLSLGPDQNIAIDCIDVNMSDLHYIPTLTAQWNHGIVNSSTVYADLTLGVAQGWVSKLWDGNNWVVQNGSELAGGELKIPVHLTEGENRIRFEVEALDRIYLFELKVTLDSRPPILSIDSPITGEHTAAETINISGECESDLPLTIKTGEGSTYATTCFGGRYSEPISLPENDGEFGISVSSIDSALNSRTVHSTIEVDRTAPLATLSWGDSKCDTQPVKTIFDMHGVANCQLVVRADLLDDDIAFWSLAAKENRQVVASDMGYLPASDHLILEIGDVGRPGLWRVELVLIDHAGNKFTEFVENEFVATEASASAKIVAPGSFLNVIFLCGLFGLPLLAVRMRKRISNEIDPMISPLDPELLLDIKDGEVEESGEIAAVDEGNLNEISIPSSHGPVGRPPASVEELADADATILQQEKDSRINKSK